MFILLFVSVVSVFAVPSQITLNRFIVYRRASGYPEGRVSSSVYSSLFNSEDWSYYTFLHDTNSLTTTAISPYNNSTVQ